MIIGLVALSAVLHVAWNVRLKTAGDPLRAATIGMLAASIGILPVAARSCSPSAADGRSAATGAGG